MIDFQAGDRAAKGYLATPKRGSGPGVLVLHAWWGLTSVFTGVCDRLAAEGYVAFAPDLYDGSTAATVDEAEQLMAASDSGQMQAVVMGSVDYLRGRLGVEGIGVVGFSMGASWAISLSTERPEEVTAVVLFYGAGDGDFTRSRAAYQGHFADPDEWEPIEGVRLMEQDMRAAGRDVAFYMYPGAGHWFFEENRPDAYDPEAARLAWERTLDFLRSSLAST